MLPGLTALALGVLLAVLAPTALSAQTMAPETYAGDFWSRPRLTGDWGGFRDTMAKHGATLDVDWLQTLQGVMSGARSGTSATGVRSSTR